LFTKDYFLLAVSNLFMMTAYAYFLVYSLFVLHIGGDKTDIGILIGVMSLTSVFCRPWVTTAVDRMGRKKSYVCGGIIIIVVSFSYQFFERDIQSVFFIHLFLRLLHGVGFAFSFVAALTFVSDLIPKSRLTEGFGIFGVTGLLGMAAGPLLAEWIILNVGYGPMFNTATTISLLGVLFVLPVKEAYAPAPGQDNVTFLKMLRHPILFRITLINLCFGFGFAAHGSFVAPYAQSKAMLASLYFLSYSTAAVCTRIFGGRLAERFGEIRIIPCGLCITGIGFLTQLLVDKPFDFITAGFITGIGHGILLPSLLALAIRPVAPQNRGKANGIFTGGLDSGVFTGSLALGVIGKHFGYSAIFMVSSFALFSGLFVFLLWRKGLSQIPVSDG
jgi:MFS family permease